MKLCLALPLTFVLAALPLSAAKKPEKTAKAETAPKAGKVEGWLDWRGPLQTGVSLEKGLPEKIEAKAALWTADFAGQSSPVIANGRLYIMGYEGEAENLQEGLACFDAETGKLLWKKLFNDFLSDVIYLRYSTSSPAIDPESGNIYTQGSQGLLTCFSPDGQVLWQHSLMEEYGRLTFPNSRTASPLIDQELVITRGITSSWGAHGPAGDRFYAFDKKSGELVWSSAPGDRPQDNTFTRPWLGFHEGKRVLYSAGGDSTLLAINARTGEPLWRMSAAKAGAKGGINAAVIQHKDNIIVVHESENIDTTEVGRMAAFKIPVGVKPPTPQTPQVFTAKDLEQWRNPIGSLASSPVLVADMIYEVSGTGDLAAVNANNGQVQWKKKLAIEQRQSSPFYADGKLYVAMYIAAQSSGAGGEGAPNDGGSGELFVIKPGEKDGEILSRTVLDGKCFGSPVGYNGKIYIQTDRKLYCFGKKGAAKALAIYPTPEKWPAPGVKAQLQIIPYEVLLQPGKSQSFRIRALDANGFTAEESVDPKSVKWESFIPPTALVKVTMKGAFNADGQLVAEGISAGQWKATLGDASGYIKGRVVSGLPINQDFESFDLKEKTGPGLGKEPAPAAAAALAPPVAAGTTTPSAAPAVPTAAALPPPPGPTNWNVVEEPTPFAYPPLWWNSARFRFEVRQAPGEGGTKAFCKTIDNKLFQRGQVFIGTPEMRNYTIEADVMTEGNRRKMSEIGVINQRYIVVLKGNYQQIEVNSNQERLKVSAPFPISPNTWYRVKARVDVAADGSGVVRGKAWKKGEPEPEAWLVEVPHKTAHQNGSPGLFGFSPQEQRAWVDNITVTPNN
jgi:outer membrane protein assembly factor BamB